MADTSASAQGSVATTTPGVIFTASASGTGTIIGELYFTNTNAFAVTVSVFRGGTAQANLWGTLAILAAGGQAPTGGYIAARTAIENERWALTTSETIAAVASNSGVTYKISGDTLS